MIRNRDVNRTRISRVPEIVPVPGKKNSQTGIFGTSLNNVNVIHGIHSQVSGDIFNIGGRSLAGRSTLPHSPSFNVRTQAHTVNTMSIVFRLSGPDRAPGNLFPAREIYFPGINNLNQEVKFNWKADIKGTTSRSSLV